MSRRVGNYTLVSKGRNRFLAKTSNWLLAIGFWLLCLSYASAVQALNCVESLAREAFTLGKLKKAVLSPRFCATRLLIARAGALSDAKIKFEKRVPGSGI